MFVTVLYAFQIVDERFADNKKADRVEQHPIQQMVVLFSSQSQIIEQIGVLLISHWFSTLQYTLNSF